MHPQKHFYSQNDDKALVASEKATLLTTLATWPHSAVYRILRNQNVRLPLVNFYGTCGRMVVTEGAYKPLSSYLDQGLDVRKGLGAKKHAFSFGGIIY